MIAINKHPIIGGMNTFNVSIFRRERQCKTLIINLSEVLEEVKQNFIKRIYTTLKNKL